MKLLFLSALGVGLALAQSSDEAAVKAAHDAYIKASKAGDKAALSKLFHANLQYSHSNAKLENRQQAIDALVASPVNFQVQSQTVHVYGKAATIRDKVVATSATGVTPMFMLTVWAQNGKDWQLVERITTRIPEQ
jgi:hypothetical protein